MAQAAAVATLEKWSRGESGWSGTAEHRSGSLNQCCGMPSRTLLGRVCILYSWMEGPVWLVSYGISIGILDRITSYEKLLSIL